MQNFHILGSQLRVGMTMTCTDEILREVSDIVPGESFAELCLWFADETLGVTFADTTVEVWFD
ncbi:MAG: hypothetical protein LC687_06530 [Actinobacteria bacterium]|nr:hypothetical protein [Actinomycetota bacterium]MCA1807484.1 hypothetical protein [Actinomycetota bacterium]